MDQLAVLANMVSSQHFIFGFIFAITENISYHSESSLCFRQLFTILVDG